MVQDAFLYCKNLMKGIFTMVELNTNASTETEAKAESQTAEPPKQTQVDQNAEKLSTYETALRKIFKVADGEELGDIDSKLTELEAEHEKLISATKDKLITASLNALDGYNTKLLARLIDKSKITVDESGNITGLEEAVKAVSDEFPAVIVKKEAAKKPFVAINPAQQTSTSQTMNDLIRSHR